ncbi:MAG: hypothetical protein ACRCU5_09495 [Rhizobiaceae bacterium]
MNTYATIGHNSGPDPLDEALAPYGGAIAESENWLDGAAVTTEAQMLTVDALIKEVKAARKAVDAAEESEAKPIYDAWKAAKARFRPTADDLDRIVKGLVSIVDVFKRKLAAEKEAVRKAAEAEAWEKTRAAQEAARLADAGNIEATRAAAAVMEEAEAAQRAAMAAGKDTVKGLRTVTETVVINPLELARWLWVNDREAQVEFQADRARKLGLDIPGVVEQRKEKRAF